jgi:hypothetical protein
MQAGSSGRWKARLVVVLGALALYGIVGELVVRSLPDETLGYRYHQETGRFALPAEFQYNLTPNSLGFHDVDHGPPSPGTRRVLLLGDSYVESYFVPPARVLGQRLEHHLNEAGAQRYEVVSIGKSGWGQRNQLEALQTYGEQIGADIILTLFLPLNDVENNSPELRRATKLQHLDPELLFRPTWTRRSADTMPLFFFRSSALNQFISHRLAWGILRKNRDRPESIPVDYFVYATEVDEVWQEAWRESERLIVETRNLAERLGTPYALASASMPQNALGAEQGLEVLLEHYPAMREKSWNLDLPVRRMAEICERNGIPFFDLEPRFREEVAAGHVLHWRFDGHWNPDGNELGAGLLAKFILSLEQ